MQCARAEDQHGEGLARSPICASFASMVAAFKQDLPKTEVGGNVPSMSCCFCRQIGTG